MTPQLALVLVLVLIAANGLFVAAEFALVSVRRPAIEQAANEGDRRARWVLRELRRISFVLSAAQFGITTTSLLVGFLAEGAIGDTLVVPLVEALGLPPATSRPLSITGAFLLSTYVQMLFGELAPKNLAIARPEAVARATAPPMRVFGFVLGPLIRVFDRSAAWVARRLFGVEVADELLGGYSLDELSRIIVASREEGTLTDEQADLLDRAVGLGDRRVGQILVPAPDVVWLDAEASVSDLRAASRETGFSRFPLRDGDEVVGTVHVKDLLGVEGMPDPPPVRAMASTALLVPESEPLRRLLGRFRAAHRTFAIVVDEYGSLSGIVTLEDLVEELVGDIEDEFDPERAPMLRRVGRHRFRLAGSMRLDRLEQELGVTLPAGDFETVAGLALTAFGRIPDEGDTAELPIGRMTVTRVEGVRVVEVELYHEEGAA